MIIGLDVGGTHTDAILLGKDGPEKQVKIPTDSSDLFKTVLAGLESITEGINPRRVRRAVLSTTLATNMIIQGKVPPVGMIVAGGPGLDPELFRTGNHYHVVSGALDHRGRETAPIDTQQVREAADSLARQGISQVGIVTKFSVRNPEHELAIAEMIGDKFENVFCGHQFSGHLNFPRRIATTYLNTAVYSVHKDFFEAVQKSLAAKGLNVPIRILKPDGGNMSFESSIGHPAQTILSGPSASVMGAVAFAPKDAVCLVLDIGGTTTDMAILIDGVPLLAPRGIRIGPYKTLIRSLLTESIGVGGDSVITLEDGRPVIGPRRAGTAMAFGGPEPTPTDAFTALGLAKEGDVQRARRAMAGLGRKMGLDADKAAEVVFTAACRQILDAAAAMVARINSKPVYTVHELWEGQQIRPTHILVLGGPAPCFAKKLDELFDGRVSLVPRWQVANAIGCALARTTSELTLFVDTALGVATAPGEHFSRNIAHDFTKQKAIEMALGLLREKALRRGANPDHLEMEVVEASQFNMVRGFTTTGRNIRVKVQVKPGLIHGYDPVRETMTDDL